MPITDFQPTSKLNSGQPGLSQTERSVSTATITGQNLVNGKRVTVTHRPPRPGVEWRGVTSRTTGTTCIVQLRRFGPEEKSGKLPVVDTPTDVSVTVNTVGSLNTNVLVGMPLLLVDGNYTVKCAEAGVGNYRWLVAASDTAVELASGNNAPQQWAYAAAQNAPGGCYTVQNLTNNKFLNWSAGGISLVAATGSGTTWQVTTLADGNVYLLTAEATPRYLNGDTTTRAVNLLADPDANEGTSWAVAQERRV